MLIAIAAARVDDLIPRIVVIEARRAEILRHAVVVQFADARSEPAVAAKELGKRDGVRELFPEVGRDRGTHIRIGVDSGDVRPAAGQEGGAARRAEWKLAIGALEQDSAGGETVDVRCLQTSRAIAGEVAVEIVGDEEEHIGLRGGRGGEGRSRREHAEHHQEGKEFHGVGWKGAAGDPGAHGGRTVGATATRRAR